MVDLYDIRQRRLRELMRDRFKGVQRELAEAVGRDPNYLSRVLSSGPHRKKIGEDFAREIEKELSLAPGFLDHDGPAQPAALRVAEPPHQASSAVHHGVRLSEQAAKVAAEWEKIESAEFRGFVSDLIFGLVKTQERAKRDAPQPRQTTRAKATKNRQRPHASE